MYEIEPKNSKKKKKKKRKKKKRKKKNRFRSTNRRFAGFGAREK
jgi:hypothetical protein